MTIGEGEGERGEKGEKGRGERGGEKGRRGEGERGEGIGKRAEGREERDRGERGGRGDREGEGREEGEAGETRGRGNSMKSRAHASAGRTNSHHRTYMNIIMLGQLPAPCMRLHNRVGSTKLEQALSSMDGSSQYRRYKYTNTTSNKSLPVVTPLLMYIHQLKY